MNRILIYIATFIFALGQINPLWAQSIPEKDLVPMDGNFLVVDSAHVFSPGVRQQLEQSLAAFAREQSTQIAVVTINDLGQYEIAHYATELGHKRGVGQKGKHNGVIILFALNNKKVFIAPGYGLEGAITDGRAGQIIDNEMIPSFRARDYEGGLVKGAQAVMKAVSGEYVNEKGNQNQQQVSPPLWSLVFVVIIILVLISIMGKRGGGNNNGGGGGQYMSRRGSDFLTGAILGSLLNGGRGGGFGGGFGGGSGGFGGGGFGGFGGGGFGGGGASGSWD